MSKDKIFSNEPKAKVYRPMYATRRRDASRPYVDANYLHKMSYDIICAKDELNLNNYRKIGKDEILLKEDIYYDEGQAGWRYTQLPGQQPCTKTYYRKINLNAPPYIDVREYRLLFPNDVLRDGDEFFQGQGWYKTGNIGQKADEIYFYRRKLQPL